MRIERLELVNVCQHENLDWTFEPGLVGIFGPNGSGKSNALNVAAYAALTNDYSRHPQGKTGMIRQQAGEEGKSLIRLTFNHAGHRAVLERGLQKPSRHRLQVDGREELRKATDIQQVIESSLGISRQLIDRYMFVGQDELYAFLSDSPATRAQSLAHLCGTTHAEKCWEILGDFISADEALAHEVIDTTDELKARVAASKRSLAEEKRVLAEAKKHRLSAERRRELERLIESAERLRYLQEEELIRLRADEEEKFAAAKQVRAKEKKLSAALAEAETRLSSLEEEAAEAKSALETYESQAAAWRRLMESRKNLAAAEERLESLLKKKPPKRDVGDAEELSLQQAELEAELKRVRSLLRQFRQGDGLQCPLCGTPVSDFEEHLRQLKQQEKEIPTQLRKITKQLAKCAEEERRLADWESQKQQAEWEVQKCRSVLESLVGTPRPPRIDKRQLESLVQERDSLRAEVRRLRNESQAVWQRFAAARAAHVGAKKLREEREKELESLLQTVDLEKSAAAEEQLASDSKWANTEAAAARGVELLQESLRLAEEALQSAEEKLRRQRRAISWVSDLRAVRDEVMHRDKLPAIVHRNALLNMEEVINDNLEMFDSPFYVEPDESLGFVARFANGTRMPAIGLSGGQKVMLALSFRLAVSSLFASQVGMMILDEPTDGLDVDNRRLAAGVFRRLGGVAKDKGYQILVITHDDSLVPAFDQTFELTASA